MRALVTGSSGFIGTHLVRRLKQEGYRVSGVDIEVPRYDVPDRFHCRDLTDTRSTVLEQEFYEVYHLAANMGGAGFVFTGENDAEIMLSSAQMNLNITKMAKAGRIEKLFFSSSACVYPSLDQIVSRNYVKDIYRGDFSCQEVDAYPAEPDSEYGWEKLFAERLFLAVARNYGVQVRIARFHNIFGPLGAWNNGREKAPAAICRKVVQAQDGGEIEVWGDGKQQRSFLYVDECVEGIRRLMRSDFRGPVNIGSTEMITIDRLVDIVAEIAGKKIAKKYVPGPTGVRGRNSNNDLIREKLDWAPAERLVEGLTETYRWIEQQVKETNQ